MTLLVCVHSEVVQNKENLPTTCQQQDKPCSYASPSPSTVSTRSLAAQLARRTGPGLTDAGNIYTESPPPQAVAALRRCQSMLDTATTCSGASSWQQQAPAVTSLAQRHCTGKHVTLHDDDVQMRRSEVTTSCSDRSVYLTTPIHRAVTGIDLKDLGG